MACELSECVLMDAFELSSEIFFLLLCNIESIRKLNILIFVLTFSAIFCLFAATMDCCIIV